MRVPRRRAGRGRSPLPYPQRPSGSRLPRPRAGGTRRTARCRVGRRRSDARALEQPRRIGTRRHCQPTQLVRGENGDRHLGDRLRSLRGDRPMAAAAPAGEAPQLVGVYLQDVNLSRRKCHGNLLVTVKEQQRLTFGEGKLYVELLIDAGRISAAQGQTRDFAAPGSAGYVTRVARLRPTGSAPKAR